MSIIDILGSKSEQHNIIGSVEADSSQVLNIFLGLVKSVGMTNPATTVKSSKKGVTITKSGNKYTLRLEMFEPPIEVTWSTPISYNKVLEYFDNIALNNSRIGWVNLINMSDGTKYLQFATN